MRVPLSWLRDFVDLPGDVDDLAHRLTGIGIKVESIHRGAEGLSGVVIGEVLSIEDHPDSDKLILVEVDAGQGPRKIVCGAKNFARGDKVPVALPGATLPGLPNVVIESKKVRGETSDGMLCSAMELGLSGDHSGIYVLAQQAQIGEDVVGVLGLDEVIFELDITPNRPDAMSLLGVAREVAAITGAGVRFPEISFESSSKSASELSNVTIEDPEGCPRYQARIITSLQLGPSPAEVQRRLSAAGVRPISNVVDATNYALLICGHPMHAFDLAKLDGDQIVVRRARAGEKLVTLDEEERALDADDLVIADAKKPVGLAGVMGGLHSEVGEETSRILLEVAYFDPPTILRMAKRHGLRTEASSRFERGVDPNGVDFAGDLATKLILEWSGGEAASGSIDVYPRPIQPVEVELRPERANLVLGTDLSPEEMVSSLERVGLEPRAGGDGSVIVVDAPTRRPDIKIEEDLIEEVARVVGFESIPRTLPSGSNRVGGLTREQKLIRKVRWVLRGAGLTEAYTSSFISRADVERIGYPKDHPYSSPIPLVNAISQDESVLRPSLIPRLVAAVAGNTSRRRLDVHLFEIGRCFRPSAGVLPEEPLRLGIVMHGPGARSWHDEVREADFFDLKGTIEGLLDSLGVANVAFEPINDPILHPGRAAKVRLGSDPVVGWIGELSPQIAGRFDVTNRIVAAELELTPMLHASPTDVEVREPARYPSTLLDLAVSVPADVAASAVVAVAREVGGELVQSINVFDVYTGEQAGAGRKSIALSLRFRSPDRTLKDSEAVALRDQMAEAISERLGGEMRA
jgi:phenylalanyl-tRNA synthetase beta chain